MHLIPHKYLKPINSLLMLVVLSACEQSEPFVDKSPISNNGKSSALSQPLSFPQYGRHQIFNYPEFSGPFRVGSSQVTLTDFARQTESPLTNEHAIDARKILVRFYYPANENEAKLSQPQKRKVHGALLKVIEENSWNYLFGPHDIGGKFLRYENYQNAVWDIELNAPLSEQTQQFPVLIFSHGYGLNPETYSALSAEIASRGYVVASINHTFGANPTIFDDNHITWAKKLPIEEPSKYLDDWSNDQLFVIDQLIQMNASLQSMFYGKLDLSRIGIFGHSYGGAAAYFSAEKDPRISAVLNIDGTMFNFEDHYINQPFAYFLSKDHQPGFDYDLVLNDAFEITFENFEHSSFTDQILWWQWDFDEKISELGRVNGQTAIESTSRLTLAFFDRYLNNANIDFPNKTYQLHSSVRVSRY
jgi:pimeloyl-ACP methyl ester carboxylesterase